MSIERRRIKLKIPLHDWLDVVKNKFFILKLTPAVTTKVSKLSKTFPRDFADTIII